MAEAVRLWLARNGRELARIYLVGESYGGFRVAELSNRLLSMGFSVQGAIMISPALEFSMLHGDGFSILPLTFALPSLTAANIELREGEMPPSTPFTRPRTMRVPPISCILRTVSRGTMPSSALSQSTRGSTPKRLQSITGACLAALFRREFLRRTDRSLSLYDAAVSIPVPRPSEHSHFDPILDGAVTVLAPAAASYIGNELGFKTGIQYRLLNKEVSGHWDFGLKPGQQGYAGSLDSLEEARCAISRA